LIDYIAKNVVC